MSVSSLQGQDHKTAGTLFVIRYESARTRVILALLGKNEYTKNRYYPQAESRVLTGRWNVIWHPHYSRGFIAFSLHTNVLSTATSCQRVARHNFSLFPLPVDSWLMSKRAWLTVCWSRKYSFISSSSPAHTFTYLHVRIWPHTMRSNARLLRFFLRSWLVIGYVIGGKLWSRSRLPRKTDGQDFNNWMSDNSI